MMGVLNLKEIIQYMNEKDLKDRLVITPLFNPHETFGPVNIDVRLGNEFIVMKKQSFPLLNIVDQSKLTSNIGRYQDKIRLGYRREFVLHPRQLIIGSTLEYIGLPKTLMCYVVGKSSWGRMGLIIATATKVDPGFRGCITLEIINDGEVPIVLYPGIPIAQLVFHTTTSKAQYKGKYSCATGPQFPDFTRSIPGWEFWYPKKDES